MKKIFIILIFVGLATSIFAQIPEGFSYQAVIRDNNETLVKSQTVAVKASILRNNEVVFTQTLNAVTNDNGLMTLTIGGTPEFGEIDWTHGPLIIKTQIDPTGGDNYTIETTAPLLTVPYSMAAKTAEKALNVPDLDNLLERINNLENQIEELYSLIGGFEPRDVPFTELELGDCEWKSPLDPENGLPWEWDEPCNTYSLVVINNYEELIQYVNCFGDAELPSINFDEFTLIFAYGVECNYTLPTYIEVQRIGYKNYVMKVNLQPGDPAVITPWQVPILVEKLESGSNVELIVTREIIEDERVELNFEDYILNENCQWINLIYDYEIFDNAKILIINSNEGVENYINCVSGNFSEINFDEYSLIIAWGVANNGIHTIEKKITQTDDLLYNLDVTIELNCLEVMQEWLITILIDKLSNATISLTTIIINS